MEELYKKDIHDPDNHDGMITHLGSDILECEVKWALGNITTNKASGKRWDSAADKLLLWCPTLCDPIDGSPRGSPIPGISPGKNTGVGCRFLLQCMKVKSESEVTQ